jgi:hypothetical protein
MEILGHVIGWTMLGAIAGFTYGWRRMHTSTDQARAFIEGASTTDDAARRHALGQQREYLLAAASVMPGSAPWPAWSSGC